jgi:ubiquinone biosynthesis protein UbiJ
MLLAGIEKLLNRSLPRSPRAQALAAALAGRRMAVAMTGTGGMVISSNGERLHLEPATGAPTDASLSAGPFSLLALAAGDTEVLSRPGAQVSGDAEVARQFSELLGLLRPDPEEELSGWVGDVPAYHLGRIARAATGFAQHAARTATVNVAEYLAHERRDLVPKAEGRQLLDGIDRLRDDVDRFEARLQQLERTRS